MLIFVARVMVLFQLIIDDRHTDGRTDGRTYQVTAVVFPALLHTRLKVTGNTEEHKKETEELRKRMRMKGRRERVSTFFP